MDLTGLPLLQRVLLVCDGTLTDTLAAAFLEPIAVRKLASSVTLATSRIDALDVDQGQALLTRQVVLFGEKTRRSYVYAESLIMVDRLPASLRDGLASEMPLGRLWQDHGLETLKELLNVVRRPADDLAAHFGCDRDCELLARTYRVITAGIPVICITEYFPAAYDC